MSSDDCVGLRYGDGVADAAEGVVATVAASGGNDKVVFATRDWIVKDDLGGDEIAFGDFRALDDLRLVEAAAISLFQPEAFVGLREVDLDVVSRNADGVVRDDFIRGLCV